MSWVRDLGANRGWVLAATGSQVWEEVACLKPGGKAVVPLSGSPLTCDDLRSRGREARDAGRALVVDDSLPGPRGCAAVRLGAHLAFVELANVCLVGISSDAEQVLPGVASRLEGLPPVEEDGLKAVDAAIEEQARRWRASSDAAQVVASYLRCHPRVAELRYPGLKGDPSFEVAARTLTNGFGPLVDYRLAGEGFWRRLCCDGQDPRTQVMLLEHALRAER